jgi:hypothetical protein
MDQGIALGEDGFWLTDDELSGVWIFGAACEGIVMADRGRSTSRTPRGKLR